MKSLLIIISLVFLYAGNNIAAKKKKTKQPNVIFILTDDQGSVDLNCYGAKDLYTPNMDNLAQDGIRFTRFYVAAPICSPSRASLLTGLSPQAAGLPGNASSLPGHKGMPTEKNTIAEVMKQAGYTTGHVGKWHLGFTPETMPNGQGFDYSYGHMGGCIDNYSHFFYWHGPNRHDLYENGTEVWEDGKYFPDLMAEKVDAFLDNNKENPFFLYYAINMPHYPLQPTKKWRDHYKDLPMPRRDYAAFVSTIDERIGHVIAKLDKLGLRENTIVIYQSDHGHSVEERTFKGGGDAGPYRGAKTCLFEGGIRVPSIISWKGNLPENKVRNQMATNVDWLPTISQLCGIQFDENTIDGKSLVPVLINNKNPSPHKVFRWKFGAQWVVCEGNWKLLVNPKDPTNKTILDPNKDQYFLVNLEKDPGERVNLADTYPDKIEHLKDVFLQWAYADEEDIPKKRTRLNHLAKGKQIILMHQPHNKYTFKGTDILLDGDTGSKLFDGGAWLGFEAKDLEAVVDMGKSESIKSVSVGFLQIASDWIFFPKYIEVSTSNDGIKFSSPKKINVLPLKDESKNSIRRAAIELSEKVRYIKVMAKNMEKCPEWHSGNGGKAWLFVDEIVVK